MSPEPKLAPVAAPAPAQPHLVPPRPARRSPARYWMVMLLALLTAGGVLVYKRQAPARSAATTGLRVLKVSSGTAAPALRVTGTTSAKSYVSINAPVMMGPDAGRGLLLQTVVPSGTMVKAGQVIAQIDSQAIRDHADDVAAMILQADDTIKRRRADQTIELENLRQNIRTAKATLDKALLDYGARDIRTEVDREILKLAVDEAQASYKNLEASLVLTQKKYLSQLQLLQLQKDQVVRHHNRHVKDAQHFTIHAPMDGLIVLNTIFRGGDFAQVQQGDQLSPGQPFAKVVDNRTMQLESSVNQSESETVRLGQTARIHLDAFPQLEFTGRVVSIGALGVSTGQSVYFVRKVPIRLAIDGSDPQLIPDLSASADLQLEKPKSGVLVPLEALGNSAGSTTVEVRGPSGWKDVAVNVLSRTNTIAVVSSGLKPGDEVAVSHP